MTKWHEVSDARIVDGVLTMSVDGRKMQVSLRELTPRLAAASAHELAVFEISPSGYGIHWPLLDEDVSIDGLLGVRHAPEDKREAA